MTIEEDKAQRQREAGARSIAAASRAHALKMLELWKRAVRGARRSGKTARVFSLRSVRTSSFAGRATRGAGSWKKSGRTPALLLKIHAGGRAGDAYAERQTGAELVASNMLARSAKERGLEFDLDAARHPTVNPKNLFCHVSLSRPPGETLTTEKLREVVEEFLKEIGAYGCNFVAMRHTNTANDHVHIIFSRSKPNGSLVSMSHNRWTWRAALRQTELQCGVTTNQRPQQVEVPTSDRVVSAQRRAQRRGTPDGFIDPVVIEKVLATATTKEEFVSDLKAVGIHVKESEKNGKAVGILFQKCGASEFLAGSSISRDFSLTRVQARIESNRIALQNAEHERTFERQREAAKRRLRDQLEREQQSKFERDL